MNTLTTYQKVMVGLSGNDVQTARHCTSSEINRMCHEGQMVLIAPAIGLFSYTYAINYLFDNMLIALLLGFVLSAMVLFIDRALVGYSRKKYSAGTIGRFLLAVGLAFTLAEPLLLRAFQPSIQEQLAKEVTIAQREAAAPYTGHVNNLQDEIDKGEQRLHKLQQAYTSEMDGTGGSGIRDKGPIYRQKKQDYEEYKVAFTAKAESLRAEISSVDSVRTVAMKQAKTNKADGLIAGLRALHKLGEKEPIVAVSSWVLRLVLIFIELCPLLIKMTPTGNIGLYYKLVDMYDKDCEKVNKAMSGYRQKVEKEKRALSYVEEYFEIYTRKLKRLMEGESSTAQLRMDTIMEMAKQRNAQKKKLSEIISDGPLLEKLHNQLDELFDDFIKTVDDLGDDPSDFPLQAPQT